MAKYYEGFDLDPPEPQNLKARQSPNGPELPKEFLALEGDIFKGVRTLRDVVNPPESELKKHLEYFRNTATVGLAGDNPSIDTGRQHLKSTQADLVDLAQRTCISRFVRGAWSIGLLCIFFGGIGTVASLDEFIHAYAAGLVSEGPDIINLVRAFFSALIGIGLGLILKGYRLRYNTTYETLASSTFSDYQPFGQFGRILAITIGTMVVLYLRVIVLGVGPYLLNDFAKEPWIAMVWSPHRRFRGDLCADRPSIPPEQRLRGLLLQAFYRVRSESGS
jgi:hypothetical protein